MSVTCSLCHYTREGKDPGAGDPCGPCADTIIFAAERKAGRPLTHLEDKEAIEDYFTPRPYFAQTVQQVCVHGALGLHTCAQHYQTVALILPNPDEEPILPEHREDERRLGNPLFDPQPFETDTFGECEVRVDTWGAPTPRWTQQERMLREWCLYYGNKVLAPHEATIATPWYLTAQYITKRLQCTHDQAMTIAACLKILDLSKHDCQELLAWIAQTEDLPFALSYLETWATAAGSQEYADPEDAMEHRSFLPNHHIDNLSDSDDYEDDTIIIPDPEEELPITTIEEFELDWTNFDQWQEGSLDEAQGLDFSFPTESWHICDETYEPDWESLQPAAYILILNKVRFAKDIETLHTLGKTAYTHSTWTSAQRTVFWETYHRKQASFTVQVLRIKNVRQALHKIQSIRVQDLPITAARLFNFTKQQPGFYSKEALALLWNELNKRRAMK